MNYKVPLWVLLLSFVFFFIILILFGSILDPQYKGGKKFKIVREISVFLSHIPKNIKFIMNDGNNIKPFNVIEKKTGGFKIYYETNRDELLVLPRFDPKLERSIIEIIDLNNYKTLFTYKHDQAEMNTLITNPNFEKRVKIDDAPKRFEYRHPFLLDDGSIISHSDYYPLYKIDICGKIVWLNQTYEFHHSIEEDHNGDIWVPASIYPYSDYVQLKKGDIYGFLDVDQHLIKGFHDDALVKLNKSGEILFVKSVVELLIENKLLTYDLNLSDPIHLNDIEPVMFDSTYFKKGDLFLSMRANSSIILYRPSVNKVLYTIKSNNVFHQQHDIDILSKNKISIFNNSNIDQLSSLLIYDFDNHTFEKKFEEILKDKKFKTNSQGLSIYFDDGSFLIDEQNKGRLFLINHEGKLIWEYNNFSDIAPQPKGNYFISWPRIIKDKTKVQKLKKIYKNKKCN